MEDALNKPDSDNDDGVAAKIRQLFDSLSLEERERALSLMERYVRANSEPSFRHYDQDRQRAK